MNGLCKQSVLWLPLMLSLCMAACSRPGAPPESRDQVGQTVPFHASPESAAGEPSDPSLNVPQAGAGRSSAVPFADPQSLPQGTLLDVRLDNPISANGLGDDATFKAVVDEAVVADGVTLVPRGTTVEGRVESARASQSKDSFGFVRLTLNSIELGGHDLPLQTSSLFVRGRTAGHASVVRLEQGRRLIFRLTEAVAVTNQVAKSGR